MSLCLLPNHPFSNLGFSGLILPILLKFNFAVSKCPKFKNWPTFFSKYSCFNTFMTSLNFVLFGSFLNALASTRWPLDFGVKLSQFLEEGKLPYLIWKKIVRAFTWPQKQQWLLVIFLSKWLSVIFTISLLVRNVETSITLGRTGLGARNVKDVDGAEKHLHDLNHASKLRWYVRVLC